MTDREGERVERGARLRAAGDETFACPECDHGGDVYFRDSDRWGNLPEYDCKCGHCSAEFGLLAVVVRAARDNGGAGGRPPEVDVHGLLGGATSDD